MVRVFRESGVFEGAELVVGLRGRWAQFEILWRESTSLSSAAAGNLLGTCVLFQNIR